ncbi:MAG TPA: hypothetical protein VG477_07055 [Thermoanaerobaculia bacterium]|nr:hypothetical protein [Thermoanaerobaculia bacterium]
MKKLLLSAFAVFTLVALPVFASTPTPGGKVWDSGEPATAVTRTVEARVLEVRDGRTLVLVDKDERQHVVQISEKVEIRAQSKKDFDGLKKLDFGHLREGHRLKLTFYSDSGQLVRIQVQKADKVG